MIDDFVVLGGSASKDLTSDISAYLDHPVGQNETLQFSDTNLFVRVLENLLGQDLHAPQVQGFFKVPVGDLHAAPVLCEPVAAKAHDDLVVVAPDAGFAKVVLAL